MNRRLVYHRLVIVNLPYDFSLGLEVLPIPSTDLEINKDFVV